MSVAFKSNYFYEESPHISEKVGQKRFVVLVKNRFMHALPRDTRAGTALLSIQKETQERTTISIVGK